MRHIIIISIMIGSLMMAFSASAEEISAKEFLEQLAQELARGAATPERQQELAAQLSQALEQMPDTHYSRSVTIESQNTGANLKTSQPPAQAEAFALMQTMLETMLQINPSSAQQDPQSLGQRYLMYGEILNAMAEILVKYSK